MSESVVIVVCQIFRHDSRIVVVQIIALRACCFVRILTPLGVNLPLKICPGGAGHRIFIAKWLSGIKFLLNAFEVSLTRSGEQLTKQKMQSVQQVPVLVDIYVYCLTKDEIQEAIYTWWKFWDRFISLLVMYKLLLQAK